MKRLVGRLTILAAPALVASLASAPVSGQGWHAPRLSWGHPDLQGVWSTATITPLERPAELAGKEYFTEAEVAEYERQTLERTNRDRRDGGAAADVARAYNDFWWDSGTRIVPTRRTALIVDPPDGRIPAFTPEAGRRQAAAAEAHNFTIGRYDALNPQALKRLIAAGTELRPYSEAILDACQRAANEAYAEFTGKNEDFKTIWNSIKAFRLDQYLWLQVADSTYDNYMVTQHRKRTL